MTRRDRAARAIEAEFAPLIKAQPPVRKDGLCGGCDGTGEARGFFVEVCHWCNGSGRDARAEGQR